MPYTMVAQRNQGIHAAQHQAVDDLLDEGIHKTSPIFSVCFPLQFEPQTKLVGGGHHMQETRQGSDVGGLVSEF